MHNSSKKKAIKSGRKRETTPTSVRDRGSGSGDSGGDRSPRKKEDVVGSGSTGMVLLSNQEIVEELKKLSKVMQLEVEARRRADALVKQLQTEVAELKAEVQALREGK